VTRRPKISLVVLRYVVYAALPLFFPLFTVPFVGSWLTWNVYLSLKTLWDLKGVKNLKDQLERESRAAAPGDDDSDQKNEDFPFVNYFSSAFSGSEEDSILSWYPIEQRENRVADIDGGFTLTTCSCNLTQTDCRQCDSSGRVTLLPEAKVSVRETLDKPAPVVAEIQ